MKSVKAVGLIIALVTLSLSVSTLAAEKAKVKKQQSKQSTKKGKKVVKPAAKASGSVTKKSATNEIAKLSTDINFNDSVLHGRYQTPDEATAKVENEKSLSDLLAVRTQFKDRLKKSSEQN